MAAEDDSRCVMRSSSCHFCCWTSVNLFTSDAVSSLTAPGGGEPCHANINGESVNHLISYVSVTCKNSRNMKVYFIPINLLCLLNYCTPVPSPSAYIIYSHIWISHGTVFLVLVKLHERKGNNLWWCNDAVVSGGGITQLPRHHRPWRHTAHVITSLRHG